MGDCKFLHCIVFTTTKARVHGARCLAISCDEMTTIDIESWINIHVYFVGCFKLILILVDLERLVDVAQLII
jgi:hypothetical protein